MKYLINFAHGKYLEAQKLNSSSGLEFGGFDKVIEYSMDDIDADFKRENDHILSRPRGAGYWLWKPYFILKTLNNVNDGDLVFYSDSGSNFVRNVSPIFDIVNSEDNGLICFALAGNHSESIYNKRKTIKALGMDTEFIRRSFQRMASFIVAKKCPKSISILKEWLSYCKDEEILTDIWNPGVDIDNYPEFNDHRHDQSIWSLITKKHAVKVVPDPTHFGLAYGCSKKEDFYLFHHRQEPPHQTPEDLNLIRDEFKI